MIRPFDLHRPYSARWANYGSGRFSGIAHNSQPNTRWIFGIPICACIVLPRVTQFGKITRGKSSSWGLSVLNQRGQGPSVPKFLGPLCTRYANTVSHWPEFCVVFKLGEGNFLRSIPPPIIGGGGHYWTFHLLLRGGKFGNSLWREEIKDFCFCLSVQCFITESRIHYKQWHGCWIMLTGYCHTRPPCCYTSFCNLTLQWTA